MIHIKTLVVGAGPAGLQVAYYLDKMGLDYLVLERADHVASFFTKYPLSGNLISINKPNTGSENSDFNLRHDWNSLIQEEETPLLFPTTYSTDYYPKSDDLVKYLHDFANRYSLKIQFSATVTMIRKREETSGYRIECIVNGESVIYICEKLIVATGLSKPQIPNIIEQITTKIKHYGEYEKNYFKDPANLETFRNKSLLLVGGGNAAFELANLLTPYCSHVLIESRSKKPWAMSTHYTGDLRSVYLPFMDTFLLKSQNAFDYNNHVKMHIHQVSETTPYKIARSMNPDDKYYGSPRSAFDHVIYCTGWTFDEYIFAFPLEYMYKYPKVMGNYEATGHPNLFFIGSIMHSLDYRASSGGFIHGFRYLIKYFMQVNYDLPFDINRLEKDHLTSHIMNKISTSSALYQMYGQLCDLFYVNGEEIYYLNNVTIAHRGSNQYTPTSQYNFMLTLEYGKDLVTDIYKLGNRVTAIGTESKSTLLHPVLRVFKGARLVEMIHFDEDLFADFSDTLIYEDKLKRALSMFIEPRFS
jgi:thioredoxin reductase